MFAEKNALRYLLAFVAVVCGLLVLSFLVATAVVMLSQPLVHFAVVASLMLLALCVAILTYMAWKHRVPSIKELRKKAAGNE